MSHHYEHSSLPLFDSTVPAHHKTDPETSAEAEHKVTDSGVRGKQCKAVLNCLRQHNGSTSAELAAYMGVDRVMPARRLPDLEKAGLVEKTIKRTCCICGNKSMVWRIK